MKKEYQKIQFKCFIIQAIKLILDVVAIISLYITERFRYMIYIFIILFVLFLLEMVMMYFINKEIYDYCMGKKKFSFKPFSVTNKKFKELLKEGISSGTYVLIENEVHSIEVSKNCYVLDFTEYKTEEEFLEAIVGGIQIKNLKKISFLAYDGNDPKEYLEKK